jgi:hypothetical protein
MVNNPQYSFLFYRNNAFTGVAKNTHSCQLSIVHHDRPTFRTSGGTSQHQYRHWHDASILANLHTKKKDGKKIKWTVMLIR